MISTTAVIISGVTIVCIIAFIISNVKSQKIQLIHKLYLLSATVTVSWLIAIIMMYFTDLENTRVLRWLDSSTYIGCATLPAFALLTSLVFVKGIEKLPKKYYLLFVVPLITNIMVWTNPWHQLFYRNFSINAAEVAFGPYMYISGLYTLGCFGLAIVILIVFAFRNHSSLYLKQALMFSLASIVPIVVNIITIRGWLGFTIAATPLSFSFTVLCHGIAIYRFHMLDIKPIAMQRVLDWVSDGYLVVSAKDNLIITYNRPFYETFGKKFNILENVSLDSRVKDEDIANKTAIYNLISSVESCKKTATGIMYEQAVYKMEEEKQKKYYYMAELMPLKVDNNGEPRVAGVVCLFRDVTRMKENMQKLQDSQVRMMENERLASLGQMVGGIAHNLKTPIMSISGGASAIENLITECMESLRDPKVTLEDYMEIYGEISSWISKQREACAYMSDIITAVKGQAANLNMSEGADFTIDQLLKRVSLLLRHEFLDSGCTLEIKDTIRQEVILMGDINSLVQAVNNLVTNAIDAQKVVGRGTIQIELLRDEKSFIIAVKDTGPGVPKNIRSKLFKEMVTSKGTQGTGLGLFISNAVVKGKFGGQIWIEDHPGGGSIFSISIPLENVTFLPKPAEEGSNEKK